MLKKDDDVAVITRVFWRCANRLTVGLMGTDALTDISE